MKSDLKKGQKITKEELENKGWEKMGPLGKCVLFTKGEKFLHFNPDIKKIMEIY